MAYIETKVKRENGQGKEVTELYLVDAMTFTEAESRVKIHIDEDVSVSAVKKSNISEIIEGSGDKFYNVKVVFSLGDDKKSATHMLVQADSIAEALQEFDKQMQDSVADYEVAAIAETSIVDIL